MAQESGRMHARGYYDGLGGGTYIGLPPVMNFGKPALQAKVIPEVLSGKKHISLAISEAFAGSDVAGLKTTAVKSADGTHYIVTGTKKWITTGHFADYVRIHRSCSMPGIIPLTRLFAVHNRVPH
jgi:alkylation response protein AidB-like acyl-CoA dehydrogenase